MDDNKLIRKTASSHQKGNVKRDDYVTTSSHTQDGAGGGHSIFSNTHSDVPMSILQQRRAANTLALSAALHHSRGVGPELHEAPRGPKTDRAVEEEVRELNDALEGQKRPPPRVRPAPLPEVAGPQAAVTVGYVAAVAPSLAVVRELDLLHDDATVQFLLQQSLLARAQEEEEARELEEVKRMEEAVVPKMQRLEAEVQMYAGQDLSQLSDLERAAVFLVARSDALRRRRERWRKRKKQRTKKLPRAPRPRCRRPCVHQRQVPAVRSSVVTQRQVPTVHSFMLPVQFLDTVFDVPVVVLRQVPGLMVQKTVVRPQLPSIVGRRHSLRSAEADPHGPDCSADHRDSSVAVRSQVVDALAVQVVRFHRLYISVYSAMLGSTVDTYSASVFGCF